MAYLGKTPSQAVRSRYYFTATGGETSLSGADDNANTLTFTDGNYVDVALNGVTLVAGTDYNTTTANTIGGLTALVASDVVEVIVYDTFSVFSGNVNGDFTVGGNITVTGTVDGRDVAADGTKLDGIEALADVTDTANVTAAGAAMLTGANFTGNVDVTGTVTADELTVDGATTVNNADLLLNGGSPEIIFQTGASHYNWMVAAQENVSNALEISSGSQDGDYSNDTWTPRLVVTSGGSVGIGTTSPDTDISKFGGSARGLSVAAGQPAITVRATANSQYVGYFGQASTNTYLGAMGGGSLIIQTGTSGTERMRLDSSGNLLVGQSTTALPGLGNTTSGISLAGQYDIIAASRTSGAAVLVNRNTDDGSLIEFSRNGTTVGQIRSIAGPQIAIGGTTDGLAFYSGGNQIYPCNMSTGGNRDATIDLGYASSRFKDLYLSGGVKFDGVTKLQNNAYIIGGNAAAGIRFNNSNDTLNNVIMNDDGTTWFRSGIYLGSGASNPSSPNHLDDYEEGTITDLRIYFDTNLTATSPTGSSYVTASGGIYTKIGRLVTVQFYFSGQYDANQVLLKHMENLPFVVGSSNNGFYGGNTSIPYHRGFGGYYRYNVTTDFSNNINLIAWPGTTTARFYSWAHSFTSTGYPLMNAGSGQELSASLTYMTS